MMCIDLTLTPQQAGVRMGVIRLPLSLIMQTHEPPVPGNILPSSNAEMPMKEAPAKGSYSLGKICSFQKH